MTKIPKHTKPNLHRLPAPGGGWAIGNVARIIVTTGPPTPEFLKHLIVKKGDPQ